MVNDTTTLQGSLDEMKDQLIDELADKGVTATYSQSTGLLGLISKIGDIQTGGGTSCPKLIQGDFTTANTGASTGSVNINYTGNGYPIFVIIEVYNGAYNNGTGGDTTWYNSQNRYDVGQVIITKARTNTTPTYDDNNSADNQGVLTYFYKSSSSSATSYSRGGSQTATVYATSSTNASATSNMVKFKGNGKTLAYYIGNRTSSTYGLARNTKFQYTIIYSE